MSTAVLSLIVCAAWFIPMLIALILNAMLS